jgi:UDP-GlcNAc3NAcA epimerase
MKAVFIVGARPNFIKVAPILDLIQFNEEINPILIHTGQHYDKNMSDVFFDELKLPKPDFNLNVSSNTHTKQTVEIMTKLEDLFLLIQTDIVVVIGDVNSTIAASLVASKMGIKLAHIESGLRSFNKSMPEEINRIVSDHLSDFLFAPSQTAMNNLENEGLKKKSYFTGDLMYDAVLRNLPIAEKESNNIEKLHLKSKEFIFITLHRPYNVDDPQKLNRIIRKLGELDLKVVFPIHPRTRHIIEKYNFEIPNKFNIIDPVGYLDSLILQKNAIKVITDSGGMQKEAFFLSTPCITLRPETEWIETLECGANVLSSVSNLIELYNINKKINFDIEPYGDGKSASKILEILTAGF